MSSGRRVERSGGLVGEKEPRLVGERAGDRDALPLTTAQRPGQAALAIGETDLGEQRTRPLLALGAGRGRASAPARFRPR